MSLERKAEMIMAIKGYECEEIQRFDEGTDIIASNAQSDEKMLLRFITDPTTKSGVVSLDFVKKMEDSIKQGAYDVGVLIGERFSEAALDETTRKNIHIVSKERMPTYKIKALYMTIHRYINDLCKTKCGQVPSKESDCKSYSKDDGSCDIRLISDNALFHFENDWINLLKHDLIRAIKLRAHLQNESDFNNKDKSIFQSVSKLLTESRD